MANDLGEQSHKHWKERVYAEADANTQDNRFFNNALKSQHLEGKMSAREMTFARNVPPVAKDANTA
jgi:hypothetical protein